MPLDPQQLKRVSTLFDEYVEYSATERDQALKSLRALDPAIADELKRWLDKDAQTDGALDRLTAVPAQATVQAANDIGDRSGQRIGDYMLHRPVGRGGMGDVYEATRTEADFDQKVAVKLLRRGLDSVDIVRRFLRERRILAQLEHPGIARLIDGGMSADGLPYLVMEFVDGRHLLDAARVGNLDLDARLKLFLDICDAVAYAHRRLIVHRDLKPSNVMLTEQGEVKLLDFGIAKLLDEVEEESLTATGSQVLTPAYAAPEQILGQPISTATDVYALGLILYELLTGLSPVRRQGKDLERVARELALEQLTKPSVAVSQETRAGDAKRLDRLRLSRKLSGDLDTIILHALKREPERRYQGAAELAEDLRRYRQGQPVRAEADTLTYRLRKFVGRHRGGVSAAILAVLGMIAGLSVALWQADVARQQAQRAEHEAAAALDAVARTRRVKNFMMESFLYADPMRRQADAPSTVDQAIDAALSRVDSDLKDDPVLQIDLLDDFGEIRAGQGRFGEARELFDRALAQAESVYGRDHLVVAESLVNRAAIEGYEGNTQLATPFIERAIAILDADPQSDPQLRINALSNLSAIRAEDGRLEESLDLSERALSIARRVALGPGDQQLAICLHNYATGLINLERFDEAEPIVRESLAAQEAIVGADSPALLPLLSNLSAVRYRQNALDEVTAINERRLVIARAAFPGNHLWTASALTDLGQLDTELERFDPGIARLREAIAMFSALDSGRVIQPLRYLGIAERNRGDDQAALSAFDQAWQDCQKRAANHPMCIRLRATRAGMLARMNQGEEALREAEAAIQAFRDAQRAQSDDMGEAMEARAFALSALGRHEEAVKTQNEAVALYILNFGEQHQETARARKNLALIGAAAGS